KGAPKAMGMRSPRRTHRGKRIQLSRLNPLDHFLWIEKLAQSSLGRIESVRECPNVRHTVWVVTSSFTVFRQTNPNRGAHLPHQSEHTAHALVRLAPDILRDFAVCSRLHE